MRRSTPCPAPSTPRVRRSACRSCTWRSWPGPTRCWRGSRCGASRRRAGALHPRAPPVAPRISRVSFPATRMRRMRRTKTLRDLVRETDLSAQHLVQPLFVVAGEAVREEVSSMPGVERLSITELVAEATELQAAGVGAVILFGIPSEKDEVGSGAYDPEGVVQLAVRALKEAHPDLVVITDVCMCEYTSHGHCGVVLEDGTVDNDLTLELLARAASSHAEAGADAVAPSDMMDGRVG